MVRSTLIVGLALTVHATTAGAQGVDTAAYLADFADLKHAMANHYANLDWAIEARGVDLIRLSQQTVDRIRAARSDGDARSAFQGFIRAFGDGHLSVRWPSATAPRRETAGEGRSACGRMGYHADPVDSGVAFRRLPEFQAIATNDSKYFPIGVLSARGGQKFGVLRIATFNDRSFPELCEEAAGGLRIAPDSQCDAPCAGPLERESANRLTAALERQIGVLKRQRVAALLVDVTNNGGGTNWVEAAARTLTPTPLRAPRMGYMRTPEWTDELSSRLGFVDADARRESGAIEQLLRRAADTLRVAVEETRKPCLRDSVWVAGHVSCPAVMRTPTLYTSGILPYAKPGTLPTDLTCCQLFGPLRYAFREGVWDGALLVVVDRETASSAEYFAAILADNGAARVVGEPTVGAGCGYANGVAPTVLSHTGALARMPNCVRYRADGTNEVEGITPNKLVPWRENDTPGQKARRLLTALQEIH